MNRTIPTLEDQISALAAKLAASGKHSREDAGRYARGLLAPVKHAPHRQMSGETKEYLGHKHRTTRRRR